MVLACCAGQPWPGDAAQADGADEGLRGGVLQHWLLPTEPAEAGRGQRATVTAGPGEVTTMILHWSVLYEVASVIFSSEFQN